MPLFASGVLVAGGAILILAVNGSVRGIEANTIGAVLVLLGLVSALVILLFRANRDRYTGRVGDDDPPAVLPRR
jgi:hypothetical protein